MWWWWIHRQLQSQVFEISECEKTSVSSTLLVLELNVYCIEINDRFASKVIQVKRILSISFRLYEANMNIRKRKKIPK
jgi:hypothetical protein